MVNFLINPGKSALQDARDHCETFGMKSQMHPKCNKVLAPERAIILCAQVFQAKLIPKLTSTKSTGHAQEEEIESL